MNLPDMPAWISDGLCAQIGSDLWFPEKGGPTREAKRICASCPVRDDCLEWGLANEDRYGIFGGLTERERRKLRKKAA